MRYAFIKRHEQEHRVRLLCKVIAVHPSGYDAWKQHPQSDSPGRAARAGPAQAGLAGEQLCLWLSQAHVGYA